jgi:hypothetical protein
LAKARRRLFNFSQFPFIFADMPRVAVIPKPNSPVEIREVAEPELERDSAL